MMQIGAKWFTYMKRQTRLSEESEAIVDSIRRSHHAKYGGNISFPAAANMLISAGNEPIRKQLHLTPSPKKSK